MSAMMETIEETTVGMLGPVRVAMANMVFDGHYELPDGTTARGLSCVLVPLEETGEKPWVGLHSEVTIHGARWKVVDIRKEQNENGFIKLEQIDAGQ